MENLVKCMGTRAVYSKRTSILFKYDTLRVCYGLQILTLQHAIYTLLYCCGKTIQNFMHIAENLVCYTISYAFLESFLWLP